MSALFLPCIGWATMTFLACLRADSIVVPEVVNGLTNSKMLRICAKPLLKPGPRPRGAVVLDRLGAEEELPCINTLTR